MLTRFLCRLSFVEAEHAVKQQLMIVSRQDLLEVAVLNRRLLHCPLQLGQPDGPAFGISSTSHGTNGHVSSDTIRTPSLPDQRRPELRDDCAAEARVADKLGRAHLVHIRRFGRRLPL